MRQPVLGYPQSNDDEPYLLSEDLLDSLHDTVLLRVVGVVFGRDLEKGGESLVVFVHAASDLFCDLEAESQYVSFITTSSTLLMTEEGRG